MKVTIEGQSFEVIEKLPHHGAGVLAVLIKWGDKEKVAVKQGGVWRFWSAEDRLRYLR